MLSLKWSDFGSDKRSIKRSVSRRGFDADSPELLTPKTRNSVRECPMINAVKPFLDTLPRECPYCFPPRAKNRKDAFPTMGYRKTCRTAIKYSKLADLPQINIHGFRHTCVSHLL